MKIGIMGGTFYPIHNGHLMLADYALKQYELDKIWFMPNGSPPHKSNKMIEDRTGQRITMVKLAIGGRENFVFQPYEVENAEISYSYKTMEHFRETYPEDEFYFIIGADSLFMLEKWKCPERLLRACVVLAACRDDKSVEDVERKIQYLNQKYDADIRLLKTPKVEISSSEIRKRIQEGHPVEDMLPKAVYDYICEKQLFRDDEDEAD